MSSAAVSQGVSNDLDDEILGLCRLGRGGSAAWGVPKEAAMQLALPTMTIETKTRVLAVFASLLRSVFDEGNDTLQRIWDLFGFGFAYDPITDLVHVVDGRRYAEPMRTEGMPCVIPCFTRRAVFDHFLANHLSPLVQVMTVRAE